MNLSNRNRGTRGACSALLLLLLLPPLLLGGGAHASSWPADGVDLTTLKIEDLMDLTVSSVGRKEQTVYGAAAAVFVITQEDIRRSGVTTIADALRMVPGVQVARIDAGKWAVSSRGFNGRFASKMLVLMDGRSVYTPLFSGVLWDSQDTLLEDIERIEVIRGPGATLWGANAVNGIINIITRSSDDSVGALVTAGGGTQERAFASARYGSALGQKGSYRLYLKYHDRAGLDDAVSGGEGHNGWRGVRGGFRLDAAPSARDSYTLQGDYYDHRLDEAYLDLPDYGDSFDFTTPVSGGNLIARWKRTFSESSDLALQLYYDRSEMRYAVMDVAIDTVDVDFQHRLGVGAAHEIVWGAGYRFTSDRLRFPLESFRLTEGARNSELFSAFLQGTLTLAPDRLHLILGSKLEHNDYTGFEVQPSARLLWTPKEKHSLWLSVSRAVRTPSRGEDSELLYVATPPVSVPPFPQPLAARVQMTGSSALESEELVAYEAGYRVGPVHKVTIDTALFYNVYRRLSMLHMAGEPSLALEPVPSLTVPMQLGNHGGAETFGAEVAGELKALRWWRLRLAYTLWRLAGKETDPGTIFPDLEGENPRHQLSLRSGFDLGRNLEADLWLRYVDRLPAFHIPSYVTLDARLAWNPRKDLQLVLVGQNLLHDRQREFVSQYIGTRPTALGRGFYGKVVWEF